MKLSSRLAGAFGLMVAMLVGVVVVALFSMGSMRASTVEINTNVLPSVQLLAQINTQKSDLRFLELRHVVTNGGIGIGEVEKAMAAKLADVESSRAAYAKLIRSSEERKIYDAFEVQWKQYVVMHEQVLDLSRRHETEDAKDLVFGDAGKLYEASAVNLLKAIDLNQQRARAEGDHSDQAYATARQVMLISGVTCALMAIALGLWLVRGIVSELGGEPAYVAALANAVADADLSLRVSVKAGDTSSVVAAMARMQQSLTSTVSAVRSSSECVAQASIEIAQGNNDLSQRTEQQAAALEQTSASMQQLTDTVQQNAVNAGQANELALRATSVATQGSEVVGRAVTTMQQVNESSRKIADIVGVIDGIAFQTNILALNAAVEAARAGEMGRGFAVVASEVRNLSSRSAEAAKEIKSLITASVEQVEAGTALVNQAGGTMSEVLTSIQHVSTIMREISEASAEQRAGVAQVGQAVNQMDLATQRNAALVEQSAASAESLKQQAQDLVQVVAVFRLADEPVFSEPTSG